MRRFYGIVTRCVIGQRNALFSPPTRRFAVVNEIGYRQCIFRVLAHSLHFRVTEVPLE